MPEHRGHIQNPAKRESTEELTMGKLVVTEFMSLDGIIEDPGGSEKTAQGGWSFRSPTPDGMQFKFEETGGDFARKMNAMPKVVVSTTLTDPTWNNTTVISGDVAAQVARLKEQYEGDVLVAGSATLVDTLREHDLVDEYRLMVHPVVLGSGKRLFKEGAAGTGLELVDSRKAGPDVLLLTYRPAAKQAGEAAGR
jgi:dihydrofolate reductase